MRFAQGYTHAILDFIEFLIIFLLNTTMFCLMSCRSYVGREVVSIGLPGSAETTVYHKKFIRDKHKSKHTVFTFANFN